MVGIHTGIFNTDVYGCYSQVSYTLFLPQPNMKQTKIGKGAKDLKIKRLFLHISNYHQKAIIDISINLFTLILIINVIVSMN